MELVHQVSSHLAGSWNQKQSKTSLVAPHGEPQLISEKNEGMVNAKINLYIRLEADLRDSYQATSWEPTSTWFWVNFRPNAFKRWQCTALCCFGFIRVHNLNATCNKWVLQRLVQLAECFSIKGRKWLMCNYHVGWIKEATKLILIW